MAPQGAERGTGRPGPRGTAMTSPTDTVSTADVAIAAPTFDNRDAFSETLRAGPRRRAHRGRLQRLGRLEQVGRLPRRVPRSPDQRRDRRAEHDRRRRRPRRLRTHPVRVRRRTVPHRTGSRADQGRCRLQPARRDPLRHEPGFAYGELGPTHHSIEDLSWLRALPGLDIVVPADRHQTRRAVELVAADPRPTYIRVGRFPVPDVSEPDGAVRARTDDHRPGRH